jgi:hypothetical protein
MVWPGLEDGDGSCVRQEYPHETISGTRFALAGRSFRGRPLQPLDAQDARGVRAETGEEIDQSC